MAIQKKVGEWFSGTTAMHPVKAPDGRRFTKVAKYGEWPVGLIAGPHWIEIEKEGKKFSDRTGYHPTAGGKVVTEDMVDEALGIKEKG
jgi:hypothetical protein